MNKPFSLIVEETKEELINVINKSNLHPSAMEMILKEIYMEINRLKNETMIREKEQFAEEMRKEAIDAEPTDE